VPGEKEAALRRRATQVSVKYLIDSHIALLRESVGLLG